VPRILMPRQDRLGISREHVYYRSPRPRVEQAPARLVWYVTGSGTDGLAAIIGCSRLEEAAATSLRPCTRRTGILVSGSSNRSIEPLVATRLWP
jgi:hypothetical protein